MNDYHSVHELHYHLVLPIKYRRNIITDTISQYLKNIFTRVGNNHNITLQEWNHDKDHIHAIFTATPATHLSKFINAYKSASSRLIKKDYPGIKKQLWESMFWSRSYYLSTVGNTTLETVKNYVATQGDDQQ